jgi:tRNA (mo5U34)-methyltransferase
MHNYSEISWFHSINLGKGIVTRGRKSAEDLEREFSRLQLTTEILKDKNVLDIGCNDGFFSLRCEQLGAHVTAIDGVFGDGLRYIRKYLKPDFQFYCIDMMSPSFYQLGRFDVILYLGILYHNMFPFEQFLRLASACTANALVFVETEYYNLPGFENDPTIFFDYNRKLSPDITSPVFPSTKWVEQTLFRVGFQQVTLLDPPALEQRRGRVTIRAQYGDGSTGYLPFLYAAQQV